MKYKEDVLAVLNTVLAEAKASYASAKKPQCGKSVMCARTVVPLGQCRDDKIRGKSEAMAGGNGLTLHVIQPVLVLGAYFL